MTSQKLFDDSLADETGTGWKVSLDALYRPWLVAADSEDPRVVLTGVYLDPAGWAVASDGFVVAVVPAQVQPGILQTEPFSGAIVPAGFLKAAHAAAKKRKLERVEVSIIGSRARYEVPGGGAWCDLLDFAYPLWRALVPAKCASSKNVNGVNPDLAAKVGEAIGGSVFRWISGTDDNAPFVMTGPDGESFGLVMPMLVNRDPPTALLERARFVPELAGGRGD